MGDILDIKSITDPITKVLKPLGFSKSGKRRWIRETPEITQCFKLIKHWSSPKNHFHLTGSIRKLTEAPIPVPGVFVSALCDVTELALNPREISNAIDPEYSFDPPEKHAAILKELMAGPVMAVLEDFGTEAGLLKLFRQFDRRNVFNIPPKTEEFMLGKRSLEELST